MFYLASIFAMVYSLGNTTMDFYQYFYFYCYFWYHIAFIQSFESYALIKIIIFIIVNKSIMHCIFFSFSKTISSGRWWLRYQRGQNLLHEIQMNCTNQLSNNKFQPLRLLLSELFDRHIRLPWRLPHWHSVAQSLLCH